MPRKPVPIPKTKICKECKKRRRIKFFNIQVKKLTNAEGVVVEKRIVFSYCKTCHSKKNKANQDKRRPEIREYNRKYQKSHPTTEEARIKKRESVKRYRENNPEKIKEKDRRYRENNAEKIKEKNRRYRENNREKINESKRRYRERKRENLS